MKFDIIYTDLDERFIAETSSLVEKMSLEAVEDINISELEHMLNTRLQTLESFQVVFKLTDITMLQYMMISNIKRLKTELEIDYKNPRFMDFDIDDEYLNDMYKSLIEQTKQYMKKIQDEATGVNGVTEDHSRYMSNLAQLCNITIYTNGKKFLRILNTLIKYDELSNIVETMSENTIMSDLLFLSTMVDPYEIYLRGLVDDVTRGDLIDELDEDGVSVIFETSLDKINEAKKNGVNIWDIETTSYVASSLAGYQELLKQGYSDRVRTENPFHVLTTPRECSVKLALPHQLYSLYYISELMDLCIMWCELIERCMDKDEYNKIFMNLIPNSLMVVYRYIDRLGNEEYEEIDMYGFEEFANIQYSRKQILVNLLQK